jgi:hypothetical protein
MTSTEFLRKLRNLLYEWRNDEGKYLVNIRSTTNDDPDESDIEIKILLSNNIISESKEKIFYS